MNKWLKVGIILGVLLLFFIPTLIVMRYVVISSLYSHFVNSIYGLTGLNKYLVKAGVALMFIPFIIGLKFCFSINRLRRNFGILILAILFVSYNLSLYHFTKKPYFSFSEGKVLKWYALTPEGVRYFDGPGFEPVYGIPLKQVTPDLVPKLKPLERGDFNPINPSEGTAWFNPITGESQIWYYKYPDGNFDFFNKPGYHPITGEPLTPVTKQIYFEWREKFKSQPTTPPKTEPPSNLPLPSRKQSETERRQPMAVIESNPSGAEVYLNWNYRGRTPNVSVNPSDKNSVLVLLLPGYKPNIVESLPLQSRLFFSLEPGRLEPTRTAIVIARTGNSTDLYNQVEQLGFRVADNMGTGSYLEKIRRYGSNNKAINAWMLTKAGIDTLIEGRVEKSQVDTGGSYGYGSIGRTFQGLHLTQKKIHLNVTNLATGERRSYNFESEPENE